MTPELFGTLAAQYGVPAAAVLLVLWLSMTGRIIWQREALASAKDTETLRRDFERQLAEKTGEITYWRDTAMDLLQRYNREVETSEAAVRTATRVIGRH